MYASACPFMGCIVRACLSHASYVCGCVGRASKGTEDMYEQSWNTHMCKVFHTPCIRGLALNHIPCITLVCLPLFQNSVEQVAMSLLDAPA